MTTNEKIDAYIKGQGCQMDISGQLGNLLDEVIDNTDVDINMLDVELEFMYKYTYYGTWYKFKFKNTSIVERMFELYRAGTPFMMHCVCEAENFKLNLIFKEVVRFPDETAGKINLKAYTTTTNDGGYSVMNLVEESIEDEETTNVSFKI